MPPWPPHRRPSPRGHRLRPRRRAVENDIPGWRPRPCAGPAPAAHPHRHRHLRFARAAQAAHHPRRTCCTAPWPL
ncbi:MAG: hypothetical protein WKG07_18935 [Hymenobacter sp.]